MKYNILLFLLLPSLSFGQDKFTYSVSESYATLNSEYKFYISDIKNQQIITVKRLGWKSLSIQCFDAKSMKEIQRNIVSDLPKGMLLEHVDWLKDKIYLYYSQWEKKSSTERLFCQEVDTKKCTLKGEPKCLITTTGSLLGLPHYHIYWVPSNSTKKFTFLKSYDGSKLLIQSQKKPIKKNDAANHDVILMYVFDEDLEELSGNEITLPYAREFMDNLEYQLDSEGIPYLLAKVRASGSDKNYSGIAINKDVTAPIELLKFDLPTGQIEITKIKLEGCLIKDIQLSNGPNNNMICAGFYTAINRNSSKVNSEDDSSNSKDNKISNNNDGDGIFYFDIKSSGEINNQQFYEIPIEILNQYENARVREKNKRKEKRGKSTLYDIVMKEFVVQADNSVLVFGEQEYYITHYSGSEKGSYTINHHNDILVTKINPEGKLVWMRKLPKRQESSEVTEGVGAGFKYITSNDKHHIIFLDNIKNKDLKLNETPERYVDGKDGFLTIYEVENTTGEVEKTYIFDIKDIRGIKIKKINIQTVSQCSKDAFILEAYKGKKEEVMIKIKVQ